MYQYDRSGPKRGVALYSYSAEFGRHVNHRRLIIV